MKRKIISVMLAALLAVTPAMSVCGAEFTSEESAAQMQYGGDAVGGDEFSAGEPGNDSGEGQLGDNPESNNPYIENEDGKQLPETGYEALPSEPDMDSENPETSQENDLPLFDNETELLPDGENQIENSEDVPEDLPYNTEEDDSMLLLDEEKEQEGFSFEYEDEESGSDIFNDDSSETFSDGGAEASSNITAAFDESTGTLTISGSGRMESYTGQNDDALPWRQYQYSAKKLVVESGITYLGDAAFYQFYNLTSVVLPSTLQEIGRGAFAYCYDLADISMSEGLVKINDYAFQDCAVTSLTLPATVTELSGIFAFNCKSLSAINVAAGNTKYASENGIVFSKDKSILYFYPQAKEGEAYTIPGSVKTVGAYAFDSAKLTKITIPGSVTTLSEGSFYRSHITNIVIPDSVTEVGDWICSDCFYLESVSIGAGLEKLSYQTFQRCYALKKVTFGKKLKDLDYQAFAYCTSLEEITIPEGVEYIKNGSFGECTSLKKVVFPSTLKGIWYQAFLNCSALTTVSFPEGLEKINRYSFYGTGITKVNLPKSLTLLGDHAFPDGTEIIRQNSDLTLQEDGSYMVTYDIPVSVSYDYTSAFQVLSLVNKERSAQNLPALTMDKDLLNAAMLRAAELSVYFSHTRPTGTDCFTVCEEKMFGENIAVGQGNAEGAMNSWMNSSGHRANILGSSFTSIGVGAVVVDGVRYWVQAFGSGKIDTASASQYKNSSKLTNVKIALDTGEDFKITARGTENMNEGDQGTVEMYVDNTFVQTKVDVSALSFKSSKTSVCTVSDKGILSAVKAGEAVITVSLKKGPAVNASLTVNVSSLPFSQRVPVLKSVTSAGYNSLKITWDAMAGAQSYTLYYKKLGASNWEQAASKISGTSYTHKGLTTGTTYVYTVRAVNKNQKSSYNKTGISGKPVPATVKLGKVMSKGYNKLKITWSKAAGASGYYIYEKINGKWKKIGTAKSSAAYYIHTSSKSYPIVTGANTTYTVKAYRNVNGKKVFGSYDKKGITGKAIPTKPVWSRISKVSNGLKLQWKKTPGATGYVVYRYENGKWVKKKTLKTLSYTDKTAKKGKTYSYKIRAYKRVNGKTVYSGYSAAKKGKR